MSQDKHTPNEYPILDLLKNRWSPRSFKSDPISDDQLNSIFEAARWAPSAANEQPWEYYYVQHGTETYEQFVNCLMPGNQPWAKNAAVLVFCLVRKNLANGNPNPWASHDLGLANSSMLHQAFSMGIYSHVMGGIDKDAIVRLLNLDDSVAPVVAIAMGFPDRADALPEPYNTRELLPRVRKPQSAFVRRK